MKSLAMCLCLVMFSAATAAAQVPEARLGVQATSISQGDPAEDQIETEIMRVMRDQLTDRGVASHGQIQMTILVDAVSDAASDRIAISLTSLYGLPKEVIELGADKEAFYLSWNSADLPEEGALVRQHMSRDWLKQFHQVSTQELRLVEADRLEDAISEMLEALRLW